MSERIDTNRPVASRRRPHRRLEPTPGHGVEIRLKILRWMSGVWVGPVLMVVFSLIQTIRPALSLTTKGIADDAPGKPDHGDSQNALVRMALETISGMAGVSDSVRVPMAGTTTIERSFSNSFHICSTTSMPRISRPCFNTRAVRSQSCNRLARNSAASGFSTGQFS